MNKNISDYQELIVKSVKPGVGETLSSGGVRNAVGALSSLYWDPRPIGSTSSRANFFKGAGIGFGILAGVTIGFLIYEGYKFLSDIEPNEGTNYRTLYESSQMPRKIHMKDDVSFIESRPVPRKIYRDSKAIDQYKKRIHIVSDPVLCVTDGTKMIPLSSDSHDAVSDLASLKSRLIKSAENVGDAI